MKKGLRRAGCAGLTLGALGCGDPARPDPVRPQELFATGADRSGQKWQKYLKAEELHRAWAPSAQSPWRPYYKTTLVAAISVVESVASPVEPEGALAVEALASRFAASADLGNAAVFVDLPGEQSVVWAVAVSRRGFVSVVTVNNWPHQHGILKLERPLGMLLYFANEVASRGQVAASPPVFILERSRLAQKGLDPGANQFDNRYFHSQADFPPASVLSSQGINRIIYVNPRGTGAGCEEDDLNAYFTELASKGIAFTYVKPGTETVEMADARPSSRNTIFTQDDLARYSTDQRHSSSYRSYPHYYGWHTNYWRRSSGAWGGSGSSGGGSRGFSS